jgi:hypothetical protein
VPRSAWRVRSRMVRCAYRPVSVDPARGRNRHVLEYASRASTAAAPVTRRGILPAPVSSFVGREQALVELHQLLGSARLVTLTGAGGVGKTRLALQVASRLVDDCADGVTPAVAQGLGVREVSSMPLFETLQAYLQGRALLVLLDNFEHVVAAAPVSPTCCWRARACRCS